MFTLVESAVRKDSLTFSDLVSWARTFASSRFFESSEKSLVLIMLRFSAGMRGKAALLCRKITHPFDNMVRQKASSFA